VRLDAEILCIMGLNICNDKWAENWPKKELCYGSFLKMGCGVVTHHVAAA
jgi:hypothetical protein